MHQLSIVSIPELKLGCTTKDHRITLLIISCQFHPCLTLAISCSISFHHNLSHCTEAAAGNSTQSL